MIAGQDAYTQVVLAEAIALGVLALSMYSFDIDAVPKLVGKNPERDAIDISIAYCEVLYVRLMLFVVSSAVIVAVCIAVAPKLTAALSLWLLVPLSHVLNSAWVYQALERNAALAIAIAVSRIVAMALVLWLLVDPEDFLLVPAIVGGASLTASFVSVFLVLRQFDVQFKRIPIAHLTRAIRDGRTIFFGSGSVYFYREFNVVLMNSWGVSSAGIAAYSLAEKFVKCLQAIARPLNQFYFPKAVIALRDSKSPGITQFKAVLRLGVPQQVLLLIVLGIVWLVWALGGEDISEYWNLPLMQETALMVGVMMPVVLIGSFNFMQGSVGLNILGARRYMFLSQISVGILNIVVCSLLVIEMGTIGGAFAFIVAEIILFGLIARRYLSRSQLEQ